MKVLWVTNIAVGESGDLFFHKKTNGLWMDSELEKFIKNSFFDCQLGIVTSSSVDSLKHIFSNGIDYFVIPYTVAYKYKSGNTSAIKAIDELYAMFSPDVIHFWGSEMELVQDFISCNKKKIPSLLYLQGACLSIARYFKAGISEWDIVKHTTIFDLITGNDIYGQIKRYKKRAINEINLINSIGNVVGESNWCRNLYYPVCSRLNYYQCPISINKAFIEKKWEHRVPENGVIITNAANYSIKGLHILLKALYLVKKDYPYVKLLIPGNSMVFKTGIKNRIIKSSYTKYIESLVKKLNLTNNIEFIGYKSPTEMADVLKTVDLFVLPSAIENHALMLKEAMTIGVPCVASLIGGIPEYAIDGQTALVYRFEEYEVLASHILRLLDDGELRSKLSENARNKMIVDHFEYDTSQRLMNIYKDITEENIN